MSNFYEILVIVSPDETDEGVDAIIGGLRQQLAASGGDIVDIDRWGRRKLAYPIGKHGEGVYLLVYVTGPATLPGEFRSYTKIRDSILREMAVRMNETQEAAARKILSEKAPVDEAVAAAQIEAADERAAAKRAEVATSMSERQEEDETEPEGAGGATAADAGAADAAASEDAGSDAGGSETTDADDSVDKPAAEAPDDDSSEGEPEKED